MKIKEYFLVSGLLFLIIAIVQAVRLFYGWEIMVNGWMVPQWVSWIAVVVAGLMAYQGLTTHK